MTQAATLDTSKTLTEVSLDRLIGLYTAVAEGYTVALMAEDEEMVTRSLEWLDRLSQAIEKASC